MSEATVCTLRVLQLWMGVEMTLPCTRCGAPGQCYAGCPNALERRMSVPTPMEERLAESERARKEAESRASLLADEAAAALADAEEQEQRALSAEAALAEERARCAEMHRRAQAYEGAARRLVRVREGVARQVDRVGQARLRKSRIWRDWCRTAARDLVAAGVPDHVDGHEGEKNYRTLDLRRLIARAIAQRDEERAKREATEEVRDNWAGRHAIVKARAETAEARLAALEPIVAKLSFIAGDPHGPDEKLPELFRAMRLRLEEAERKLERGLAREPKT